MKVEGSCHCGNITYEAEIDPAMVAVCHCTDCQTLSGAAFRTVARTRENTFKLLTGTLKVYVKTGDSGNQRTQSFCPECGAPIYSGPVGDGPKVYSLRVGSIHQRNQLVPAVQYWSRSAQPWLTSLETVPKLETQPVFDPKGGDAR